MSLKTFTLLALGFCVTGIIVLMILQNRKHVNHECKAPCTVILPNNTQEDEFGINYGWRDHKTPIVDVYKRR